MKVIITGPFFSPDGNINIACCLVTMYTSILEVECATILRKNPRLKGILFCVLKITCVLKIQNGKVIRYDVIFSALNQQRSKNIQPEPRKKTIFV